MKDNKWNNSILYKPVIVVLDSRWLPIDIELSVLYRINPNFAAEILTKY